MKITKILSILVALCITLSTTCFGAADLKIDSVTRQDPSNTVIQWTNEEGKTYEIYRTESIDGQYKKIGETSLSSFRDENAEYPKDYYYKLKNGDTFSDAVKTETNPQKVHSVSVIMYHNFITEEDIANGVEFEEYSLDPADFEEDLIWLRDNGYTTITSKDLILFLKGEKTLPEKAVILSIDDGTWGVYKNAWPLLKKYNMKADFNLIGQTIDKTWDKLYAGGTRTGESAPYCTWEELLEMSDSGEINLCSHSYALHYYDRENRIGMQIMDNESREDYANVIKEDYDLAVSCIGGWSGKNPETVAYPYSRRSQTSDEVILENTGYEILMAGQGHRGTEGNYFVSGCDFENQLRLMSRPCRMDGTPISEYLKNIEDKDFNNGVNYKNNTLLLTPDESKNIAKYYSTFEDVSGDSWYAGSIYYSYLNGFMKGVSETEFSPNATINRAMAATLLHRAAGTPTVSTDNDFADVKNGDWFEDAVMWTAQNGILPTTSENEYKPMDSLSREALSNAIYQCAKYLNMDLTASADLSVFSDMNMISAENTEAIKWVVSNGILKGNADGTFNPKGNVTRAEMATILQNWFNKFTK